MAKKKRKKRGAFNVDVIKIVWWLVFETNIFMLDVHFSLQRKWSPTLTSLELNAASKWVSDHKKVHGMLRWFPSIFRNPEETWTNEGPVLSASDIPHRMLDRPYHTRPILKVNSQCRMPWLWPYDLQKSLSALPVGITFYIIILIISDLRCPVMCGNPVLMRLRCRVSSNVSGNSLPNMCSKLRLLFISRGFYFHLKA